MSFYTYHSNHLDLLQQITGLIIKNDPLDSLFDKEYFLVQNFGMAKWMQVQLADQLGILTQAEFLLPSKMLNNLFEIVFSKSDIAMARLNQDQLFWPLIILLDNLPNDPQFDPIRQYIAIEEESLSLDDHAKAQKRLHKIMMLAKEVAQLFDQYIVHRSDWIEAWDNNLLVENLPEHQVWQKALWDLIRELYDNPIHFGNIRPYLIEQLTDPSLKERLPKRIFIMGLTSLPPLFLDLLLQFSPYIDIHLFFNNPSQFYWGDVTKFSISDQELETELARINFFDENKKNDIISPHMPDNPEEDWQDHYGHPLLASFGKVGRDHLRLLAQYEPQEIEAFSEPVPSSLLKHLHYTIFNLLPIANTDRFPIKNEDHSIAIHQVYSRMREIEVLYDQLLHHFNQDPSLNARDIVIMTPDIEEYAPIINAVFGNTHRNRYIPYSISDVSITTEEPILEVFIRLLTLPESYFRASEIIEILQTPDVHSHFKIEADQLELIAFWIQDVGIHYGIDDSHLSTFQFQSDGKNHWLWGVKRLLLGYLSGDQHQLYQNHLAYPYIEGLDSLILGNLIHFIDRLIHWRDALTEPRPLKEWQTIITDLWNDFFTMSDEGQLKLNYLLSEWQTIINSGIDAGFTTPLPLRELRILLEERINDERPEQNFIQGKVTFCSFIPMRAIPFKFVGMIGLTQEAFPKTTNFADFNLMQYQPYPGDRTRHNDDRYLFLEAILSANDTLYLSYIGRSIQDNSEKLPSLLIDELLNYLEATTDISHLEGIPTLKDHLIFEHPLASYNRELFKEGSLIQSFQHEWLQESGENFNQPYQFEPYEQKIITPYELVRFYQKPIEIFCRKRLDLQEIRLLLERVNDDEPFFIGAGLTQYQLRSAILKELIKSKKSGDTLNDFAHHELLNYFDHQGILPKFNYRDITWERLIEPLLIMANRIYEQGYDINEQQSISLTIDDYLIEGMLPQLHQDHYLLWDVGRLNRNRKLRTYLYHLMQNFVADEPITTTLLYIDKHTLKEHTLEPIERPVIIDQLQHYIEYYYQGLTTPFIPSNAEPNRDETLLLSEIIPTIETLSFEWLHQAKESEIEVMLHTLPSDFHELLRKLMEAISHGALERRLFPNIGYREATISALFYYRFLQNI